MTDQHLDLDALADVLVGEAPSAVSVHARLGVTDKGARLIGLQSDGDAIIGADPLAVAAFEFQIRD